MSFGFFTHNIDLDMGGEPCVFTLPTWPDSPEILGVEIMKLQQMRVSGGSKIPAGLSNGVHELGAFAKEPGGWILFNGGLDYIGNAGDTTNRERQVYFISKDNGVTWTKLPKMPFHTADWAGSRCPPASRMEFNEEDQRWWVWLYWSDNRASALWSIAKDAAAGAWVRTPLPDILFDNIDEFELSAATSTYGRGGFVLDGAGKFVECGGRFPKDFKANWLAIARRSLSDGVTDLGWNSFIDADVNSAAALPVNSSALLKIGSRYLEWTRTGTHEWLYYFSSNFTTYDFSEDPAISGSENNFKFNGVDTVLLGGDNQDVLIWTAPITAKPFPSFNAGPTTTRTNKRFDNKNYMWLYGFFASGSSGSQIVVFYHSTNPDGTDVVRGPNLRVPGNNIKLTVDSARQTQLFGIADGYWLLLYNDNASNEHNNTLIRFKYETITGDCDAYGWVTI